VKVEFGSLVGFAMSGDGIPTLQTDQMNVIAHHIHSICTKHDLWSDKTAWPDAIDSSEMIDHDVKISKLQRKKLQLQDDWEGFRNSERKQLNRYDKVGMFGNPIRRKQGMNILPWVWTYLYKDTDGEINKDATKSRGTCNGGPRFCDRSTLAETYAACVEQPIHRLTWSISAVLNLVCKGYDIGNAFAEAPAPTYKFYMQPNDQFREWWTDCLGKPELKPDEVIPIYHALQGHPESPRLWDKYITKMLVEEFDFETCTHESCLYYKRDEDNNLILITRQVDDLKVSAKDSKTCDKIAEAIQKRLTFPLNFLGTVR